MDLVLTKYENYSRKQVHGIFDGNSQFTHGTGTARLQGIVKIPNKDNDYVFFVTLGRKQAEHVFDEGITKSGILKWQSQPSQKLTSPTIIRFIQHDHLRDNIHLFFRTETDTTYTYLGMLAYISHDDTKEQPVYFNWQILEWNIPESKLRELDLILLLDETGVEHNYDYIQNGQLEFLATKERSLMDIWKAMGLPKRNVTSTIRCPLPNVLSIAPVFEEFLMREANLG